ncbi:MAG TPA: ABC transporter ATP-binding protein, partial [Verrucomicrobiae bacterium]|nr:ABC transporter ATP-binding protein [Verrucomicrobiae bacterium]
GVLLGVLFGLSNASFIWATKTMVERMDSNPRPAVVAQADAAILGTSARDKDLPFPELRAKIRAKAKELQVKLRHATDVYLDPWLPKRGREVDWRQMLGGLIFFPILVAFRGYIGYLSSYCLAWTSERVVNDLRVDVLKRLSDLSLDFFNRSTMGDLLTRLNSDAASLQRCLSLGLSDLVKEPVTIVGVFTYLLWMDTRLTLACMIFVPVIVVPMAVLGKKVRKASKGTLNVNVSQSSLLVEMLSGIRVVKAFGLETEQVARFRRLTRELIHHTMKGTQARELVNPTVETVSMFGFGAMIVYIAMNQRTTGDMVGFLLGVGLLFQPIKKLGSLHILFQQTSIGVDRLIHILQEQPSVKEPPQPKPLASFQKALRFENVTFSYKEEPVLRDLTLEIPRGLRLGVAGESGSGKSTLINLLFRFYDPTSGTIRVDGADIREVSMRDLRLQMALVSQEIVLFDESVADNIARGKPGATRAEIEAAAKAAFAHDFIMKLEKGYDSRIGERGVTLSGGQRQRLAIARAFVRNAPILVLDEATASLDSQSEAEVQAAIDKLAEHRTVVCVAHRLSTLASMDQIIVLSKGRIIEAGSFDDLLRKGGVFAGMAAKQGIFAGARE